MILNLKVLKQKEGRCHIAVDLILTDHQLLVRG